MYFGYKIVVDRNIAVTSVANKNVIRSYRKMNFLNKKQNEMKKQSKKGFTLVEVIVVIVIIAILAAIAVPALTGYIERAKSRSAIVEARNILVALQTISVESYAGGARIYGNQIADRQVRISGPDAAVGTPGTIHTEKKCYELVNDLIGTNYTAENYGDSKRINFGPAVAGTQQGKDGVVAKFVYVSDDGIQIEYTKAGGFKRIK